MIVKASLDLFDWKLYVRSALFLLFSGIYILNPQALVDLATKQIGPIMTYQILWVFLMAEMAIVFFPKMNMSLGCGKVYANNYVPSDSYSPQRLSEERKQQNKLAFVVAILWIMLIAGIGWLHKIKILDKVALCMISLFFYLADQICINIWCPFRKLIMKNKCCNSCRIFNWGHIMMFSPLIFILSFWAWSLVIVSVVITLQWEIVHARHPERFSEISNLALKCNNCTAKCKWLEREKKRRLRRNK